MIEFFRGINEALWGWLMPVLFGFVGIVLTLRLRFFQVRSIKETLRYTFFSFFHRKEGSTGKGFSSFQAASTALAGTVGTGSITGIASALVLGGPGVLFWMWVSAFFGAIIKYAEILLSVSFQRTGKDGRPAGGPMFYIFGVPFGKTLAIAFSVATVFTTFGIGNTVQSNAIATVLEDRLSISPSVTGAILAFLCAVVILGGAKRIGKVNEALVPVMSIFYVLVCFVALMGVRERLPSLFLLVIKSAFSLRSAAVGIGGYHLLRAVSLGLSRGVFVTEAGLGSAPIAHGGAKEGRPAREGLWGLFEVYFTILGVATLTFFVILSADLWQSGQQTGAVLSIASFQRLLPGMGDFAVIAASLLFALSSLFGWAYYGEVALHFLFGKKKSVVLLYRFFYLVFAYVGAVSLMDVVWTISELMNCLMALPNLLAILFLSGKVAFVTKEEFPDKFI